MKVEALGETASSFLKGGGDMGKILLLQNWDSTPLGNPILWQQSLKNTLNIVLNSSFPSLLVWGSEYQCFYNDSYKKAWIDSDAHPLTFGQCGVSLFSGSLPVSKKIIDDILSEKKITGSEDLLVPIPLGETRKNVQWTFYYNAVYDDQGNTGGVLVSCNDIDIPKYISRLEIYDHHIIEAEEKARLAIESADLGTYEVDLRTDEIKISERFKKICGVEGNITQTEFASRIHPDDQDILEAAHLESLKTGSLHYEARVIHNDGSHHWVKVKGHMSYDHAGKPLTLLGVIQDITEQKVFADGLQKLVQERTEELQALNEELVATNEELIQSNAHFIRVNKELEQFAYVASHDLQEPLRKIQIFANILNEKYTDDLRPEAAVYMEKIAASASRMSNLIKDLLDYSRLSYNSSLFKTVDLNVVVRHVINDFELLISQKGVSINVDQLPSMEAIPIQMNQLFYNIIGNSIKFSRKTVKPVITIASRILVTEEIKQFPSLKTDKQYLQITIADNGIGFSQQYAEQIFTIFQRLNDKSKYGGYGIGLALCRRIVENHNGIISAKGIENEGATFVFVLPMKH
jgi:PAS domain S-box-containing protein